MLEKYIPKRFATAMIKHVIAVTLFFPYFYSHNGNWYYQDFILANFFAVLAIVFICTSWKLDFKRNGIFVAGLGILLIAYNVCATYMNVKYHHWYGEQINTTIAFLFFIVLLLVKDPHALIDTATIKATIHMIVASNVLAICFRTLDKYERLFFMNSMVELRKYPSILDKQYAWLYGHKSEYGLILVLCVAFFVFYRKQFRNILTYLISLGVLFVALYISESYTAMCAAMLIFIGQFLDYLWKAKWWKKLIVALATVIPLVSIFPNLLLYLKNNRDFLTLGKRTYIWRTFIHLIQQNPNGIIAEYGSQRYRVDGWLNEWNDTMSTSNCHNVFLNHIFRYSIPVGIIFFFIFLLITSITIKRNMSFITFFTFLSIFICLSMDHSLTVIELSFYQTILFLIFHSIKNDT